MAHPLRQDDSIPSLKPVKRSGLSVTRPTAPLSSFSPPSGLSDDPLLTTKEVAQILRKAERTVSQYADFGTIRGFKVGREWRFRRSDVERYLKQQEEEMEGLEK